MASHIGLGVVVSLGGADIWSNAHLTDRDNALLGGGPAGPGQGVHGGVADHPLGGRWEPRYLEPRTGPGQALPGGHRCGRTGGLPVAGRRLGRPVLEDPAVPIPGSELVVATGRLLARNRRAEEAAQLLRSELTSQLLSRYGQGRGAGAATVASVVAQRRRPGPGRSGGSPRWSTSTGRKGAPGPCPFVAAHPRRGDKWDNDQTLRAAARLWSRAGQALHQGPLVRHPHPRPLLQLAPPPPPGKPSTQCATR